jgi:hypothetical protein
MHFYKNLVIFCCIGVQLAAFAVILRQLYFGPHADDPEKAKMKRIISIACFVLLISCIGAVTIQWVF